MTGRIVPPGLLPFPGVLLLAAYLRRARLKAAARGVLGERDSRAGPIVLRPTGSYSSPWPYGGLVAIHCVFLRGRFSLASFPPQVRFASLRQCDVISSVVLPVLPRKGTPTLYYSTRGQIQGGRACALGPLYWRFPGVGG